MAIIERSWRTIGEMASVMLLNADLGEELWEEATNYAVNIYNRTPPSKPDSKGLRVSPYEKGYRERPILTDLIPFGCRGYTLLNVNDKNHRGRSQQVIYMGRDFNTIGGARFYHAPLSTLEIVVTSPGIRSRCMILSSPKVLG